MSSAASTSSAPPPSTVENIPVSLRSCDGWTILAEESLVAQSGLIRSHLLHYVTNTDDTDSDDDDDDRLIIPLHNVDFGTLALVIEYCRNRIRYRSNNALDSEFIAIRASSHQTLHNLFFAAQTLEIESLLNLTRDRLGDDEQDCDCEERIRRNFSGGEGVTYVDWLFLNVYSALLIVIFIVGVNDIVRNYWG